MAPQDPPRPGGDETKGAIAPQKDLDFLKQEYFHLQKTVEDFDARTLTVKQWSITTSMAGVAVGVIEEEPVIFLLAAVASFVFWVIEALWKSFQSANYARLRRIEDYLNGEAPEDFRYPYITRSWSHAWRKVSMWRIMWWSHVYLPHLLIVVGGVAMWAASL